MCEHTENIAPDLFICVKEVAPVSAPSNDDGAITLIKKKCSNCGASKSLSDFHKSNGGKHGVNSVCKNCVSIKGKQKRDILNKLKPPEIIPTTKVCTRCKIEKEFECFHGNKHGKYGINSICKLCHNEKRNKRNASNSDKIRQQSEAWRVNKKNNLIEFPPTTIKKCRKCKVEKLITEFRARFDCKYGVASICNDCERKKTQYYRNIKKDKSVEIPQETLKICTGCGVEKSIRFFHKEVMGKYGVRSICMECINGNGKKYRKENNEKERSRTKKYRSNNKHKIKAHDKKRRETDPLYKLKQSIRRAISDSLRNKGYGKKSKTYSILGCTWKELKEHIENQFEDWMTWGNYGKYNGTLNFGWDLDHVVPLSTAKTEEDVVKLNHYTNFQPLCSFTNRYIKKDRVNYVKQ